MATHPVTALPWYARGDYPALLRLFSDPDMLPATYDSWLKRAERTENQLQKAGFGCREDLDSPGSLCGLVQGAQCLSGPAGAPDFRK